MRDATGSLSAALADLAASLGPERFLTWEVPLLWCRAAVPHDTQSNERQRDQPAARRIAVHHFRRCVRFPSTSSCTSSNKATQNRDCSRSSSRPSSHSARWRTCPTFARSTSSTRR